MAGKNLLAEETSNPESLSRGKNLLIDDTSSTKKTDTKPESYLYPSTKTQLRQAGEFGQGLMLPFLGLAESVPYEPLQKGAANIVEKIQAKPEYVSPGGYGGTRSLGQFISGGALSLLPIGKGMALSKDLSLIPRIASRTAGGAALGYGTTALTEPVADASRIGEEKSKAGTKAAILGGILSGGGTIVGEVGKEAYKLLNGAFGISGKDLAKILKEITSGNLSKETQEALAKSQLSGKRAGVAEEIVKKQTDIPSSKYGELPGVSQETVAGKTMPLAESSQKQGSRVRDIVLNIFETFNTTRKTNADANFKNLFDFAYDKELQGLRLEDTKAFDKFSKEIKTLLRDPETGLANIPEGPIKQQILQIQRALDPRIIDTGGESISLPQLSYKAMETLRRVFDDRASGLPAQGADAISQQLAGDLSKGIREILREFTVKNKGDVSLFDKAINDYKRDSEFLRAFNTKVGKALTEEQLVGKGFNIAKVSAQDIPKNVFKNKESFDVFVEALNGNEKLAQEEAKKYFSNLMQGMNGKQLEQFITNDKNRQMLKLTGSYDMADAYTKSVQQAEKRVTSAGEKATSRRAIESEQKAFATELQTLQTDVNRAKTIDEINTATVKVINVLADPKVGKLTIAQRDALLTQIKNITDLQKKKELINRVIKFGLGGTGVAGLYSIYSSGGR